MAKVRPKPSLTFSVRIKGDPWKIRLYTYSKFLEIWPGTMGITEYLHKKNDRVISFRGPKVCKDTIAHELLHAYLSYHDFSRTSYAAIEEKICEVLGKKHKTLYNLTNKIYSKFRKKARK